MHAARPADRDVFAGNETFLAEAEARLIVAFALLIVDESLTAGFAAQASDPILPSGREAADTTGIAVCLPQIRVQPPVGRQRHHEIVAIVRIAGGMARLPCENQTDMSESRGDVVGASHSHTFRRGACLTTARVPSRVLGCALVSLFDQNQYLSLVLWRKHSSPS